MRDAGEPAHDWVPVAEDVADCPYRASLIVTASVTGTSSNIAKRRVELVCRLAKGHRGLHEDPSHGEKWEDDGHVRTTILRHESDE